MQTGPGSERGPDRDRRSSPPTGPRGGAFYDDPVVFGNYHRPRPRSHSPNYVMEEPAFLEVLGSVDGQRVVDLGCGDAGLGAALLRVGARSYLGVDGSARMVDAAGRTLQGTSGRVVRCDIEDFVAPPDSADVVVSRLALHYVRDLTAVLARCRACLAPTGRVVFTVLHPVTTCHDPRDRAGQRRADWTVDNYFVAGPREQEWLGGAVTWHHRTIEDCVSALQSAGFALTSLRECAPRSERFDGDHDELTRRRRVPLFLLLAGGVSSAAGRGR